jgi:anaerobic selenocysteine-containing dehydrogenase
VEHGRVVEVMPASGNRATACSPCLKGLSYTERAYSDARLYHPMKRSPDGRFARISWDDAFSEIAERLLTIKERYGPEAVFFYESSGMAGLNNAFSTGFWRMFGGATTTFGNLCWPAGLEAVRLTLGENKHNAPWDLEQSRLIILWGKNPAETNIHQMVFLENAARNGARIVVIDPRRTSTAEKADLLIQPKPGTDAALALTIAHVLIREGWFDRDFISRHVYGFEQFARSVEACTPEWGSSECDIPVSAILELARDIGTIQPMTIIPGFGMQRFSNGGQTIRCLLALNILTGNIGKPGACFHFANLQSYVFDEIKEPECYYPDPARDKPFRRTISKARLGEDMLNAKDPPLKFGWVERGNPIAQNPDSNLIRKAFSTLEFLVVVEEFMTDTALEADLVLPAKNMFEQPDILGSYWHPYIQFKPKVVDIPEEVKTEPEIYFHLAEKLGFSKEQIQTVLPEPGDEPIMKFLRSEVNRIPGLRWNDLLSAPQLPPLHEEISFADLVFLTPSGKIELWSDQTATLWAVDPLPKYEPITSESGEFPFRLLTPNTKNRIHSQFGNLIVIKELDPLPYAAISAGDALAYGFAEGERVRIFNRQGNIETVLHISFSLKRGCIVYYNGYWHQEGGSPNSLTKGLMTDMGYGTAFHDTMVAISTV